MKLPVIFQKIRALKNKLKCIVAIIRYLSIILVLTVIISIVVTGCRSGTQHRVSAKQNSIKSTCDETVFSRIAELDRQFQMKAGIVKENNFICKSWNDWETDASPLFFKELSSETNIHPSYGWTLELCDVLQGIKSGDDESDMEGKIDHYLSLMSNLPPIDFALKSTGTDMANLKMTWFGKSRGFLHVICGEPYEDQPQKVGGYHFWYRFYQEERRQRGGSVNWRCTLEGESDPNIATIRFDWIPIGKSAPRKKEIGGFTIGESPAALLALGHIAHWNGCDLVPWGPDFVANVNGQDYRWAFASNKCGLKTLFPIVWKRKTWPDKH